MFFYIFAEGRKNMHGSVAISKWPANLKKTSVPIQPERSHPDAIKKTGAVEAPVYLCEEGYACLKN
jgi:hypothetical protein